MAFLTLFSTLSFAVEKHLCSGKVEDISVFGNLEHCGSEDENHDRDKQTIDQESCCQDQVQFVQGSNSELNLSQKSLQFTQTFGVLFTYTYFRLFEHSESDADAFLSYSPPIVVKDIPVLYETFLI